MPSESCALLAMIFGCHLSLTVLAAEGQTSELEKKSGGTLEGLVTFVGEVPKSAVPDDAGIRRELLEVDGQTGGLRNVVVYLTPATTKAGAQHETAASGTQGRPMVDQENNEFTPRVIAVEQGQTVVFSNSDPANHNVRTTASVAKNQFNVFTGIGGKYEHRFVIEPDYRPVRLGCDIHPWMRGWVFVFDHALFSVTDEQGRFRITEIPPGEYWLTIVQPDVRHREQRKIEIQDGESLHLQTVVRQKADSAL
jgi:plastocyanin